MIEDLLLKYNNQILSKMKTHKKFEMGNFKSLKSIMLVAFLALVFCFDGYAQEAVEFKRGGDRNINGINLMKRMNDISIVQATVLFQNATKRGIFKNERGLFGAARTHGASMSAELNAYLVFSDGEPSDAEYQKVVDDFYVYLNKKLDEKGIKTTPWQSFANSTLFTQLRGEKEDVKTSEEMTRSGNAWKIITAYNGPRAIRYNPVNHYYNAPAVRGTVRLSNYGKDVKVSTVAALNIVVDFADIYLDGDVRSGVTERTFSTVTWQQSEVKYDVSPRVKVTGRHTGGNQIFLFPANRQFDEVYSMTDVRAPQEFMATVSQDEEKIKRRSWLVPRISTGQRHDITPFVVETTKEEYFKNVKEALERYADELATAFSNARR